MDQSQNTIEFLNDNNNENKPEPVKTKLHVSNIPENCTRRHLTELFSNFGNVKECSIMFDKYAFIHYGSMEEAQNALDNSESIYLMGKKLVVRLSTSRNRQKSDWYQQEASKMYLELLNKSKNEGLDSSNSSLTSSNFIETKLYVTNLPDDCNQAELKSLFEKYGEVLECVVMWSHYAFIHFGSLNEAKKALENLNGHLFYGKNLIVAFSTSSNRPLPKSLALSNTSNKIKTSSNNKNQIKFTNFVKATKHSSNDLVNHNVDNYTDKQEKNWIQILKNGCLPVAKQNEANNLQYQSVNLDILFKKSSENTVNETIDSEIKKPKSSTIKKSSSLKSNEYSNDDTEADADTDIEFNSESSDNTNESKNKINESNLLVKTVTSKKIVDTRQIRLDQIPTPPLPNQLGNHSKSSNKINNSVSIGNMNIPNNVKNETSSLKELIDNINKSKKMNDLVQNFPSKEDLFLSQANLAQTLPTVADSYQQPQEIFFDDFNQTETEIENIQNEQFLIEQLNRLKFDNEKYLLDSYNILNEPNYLTQNSYSSSSSLTSPLLRIDNILKPPSLVLPNDSQAISSCCSSKESQESSSISTSFSSPYTFDYLSSNNFINLNEDNLQKSTKSSSNSQANNYLNYLHESHLFQTSNTIKIGQANFEVKENCIDNLSVRFQQADSYVLFPELHEQEMTYTHIPHLVNTTTIQNDLLNLLRQNQNLLSNLIN